MQPGQWYVQTFSAGDQIWFKAVSVLKNGGLKGFTVEWRTRTPKAKHDSVPSPYARLWRWVAESDVPKEVRDAADRR